ncbi:hypothetical protein A0H76_696 [Hepatospora eriocheir]|uniref:Uncharacterized protein n=1 Tax=Hepatospora eriocheir TaxID=1081669 RepID=A0A1X0QIC7_9MICR|nr:hypothetical protein A0H76_696 [Hepatospora eriocheir]
MRYDGKYLSWRELLAKMRSDLYKVEINEEKRVKEKELANKLAEAEKKIEEMKDEKQREKEKCMEDKINELTMKLDRLSIVSRTGPRRSPKCFGCNTPGQFLVIVLTIINLIPSILTKFRCLLFLLKTFSHNYLILIKLYNTVMLKNVI